MHAAALAALLALAAAHAVVLEAPERGGGVRSSHGHALSPPRTPSRALPLPIPTPQEIDALRQLVHILASLAGASSQVADESAPLAAALPARRTLRGGGGASSGVGGSGVLA